MLVDIKTACREILSHDNILIFAHQKPDGDTLGASFALLRALHSLGKKARVFCADGFPVRYGFICGGYVPDESFEPKYVIAADIASAELISDAPVPYSDRVDLCIDHHKSNTMYAKMTLLDVQAPAACQVIIEIIEGLGVSVDSVMATALFAGLSTDTGCFKYSNVTAQTHRAAALMIDAGAEHAKVNKLMFDTKSRGMLKVDRILIETVKFYEGGKIALSVLPADIGAACGVNEDELDGISSFPIRIDGVLAGITVRAKPGGTYRVSLRSVMPVDSSLVCSKFGGGGHTNAAGCTMKGELDSVVSGITEAAREELKRHGLV